MCWVGVVAQALGTGDGVDGVRDDSITPSAHLVSKRAEAGEPAATDRAFNDNASGGTVGVRDRPRVLDDETPFRHTHLECGVVEVEWPPPLEERLHGLVDASVQPNEPATCTERKPVQIDPGPRGARREERPGCPAPLRLSLYRHGPSALSRVGLCAR
jgi:hypothetical protein